MSEFFYEAKPVWLCGRATEPNTQMVLSRPLPDTDAPLTLFVTGFTDYRVFVDDTMIHFGPARTARGYARVDVLSLPRGKRLSIAALGYYCCSLSTEKQPSFVCAELRCGEDVVAATGRDADFESYAPTPHVQKVMRYSRQRHFSEIWDFRDGIRLFSADEAAPTEVLSLGLTYLPRRTPLPDMSEAQASSYVYSGVYEYDPTREIDRAPYRDGEMQSVAEGEWGGFPYDEIERKPFWEFQRCVLSHRRDDVPLPLTLHEGEYAIVDFGVVEAGFLDTSVSVGNDESDLIIAFAELCDPHAYVRPYRLSCVNVLEYLLPKNEKTVLRTAEPYTMRYALLIVRKGEITLNGASITRLQKDPSDFRRVTFDDPTLRAVDEAAMRSFAHNSVDLYTDCPSRERAGWLCDSYFTSQVEWDLTARTDTEDAFLENFRLFDYALHNAHQPYGRTMPKGMVPMCYPAEMSHERFIPQWAMWLVLEIDMYCRLRRPDADREAFRPLVLGLCDYFAGFENADGLLERMEAWQFIDWSGANNWGQDINYPTNFLYAEVLDCADRLFGLPDFAEKAARLRECVIARSFNGTYFVDHAVYGEDGVARNAADASETAQYYAIRFGHIDLSFPCYAPLREILLTKCSPGHSRETFPDFEPADALMGIYLRLEWLAHAGDEERALAVREIADYFGERAKKTGTLWEYVIQRSSLDHGFAAFAATMLRKAMGK